MLLPEHQLVASRRFSDEYWNPWKTNQDIFLQHYTDAIGLHGIVTNRHLRLTNISYLNDATEHQQAGVALRSALSSLVTSSKSSRHSQFYQYLEGRFEEASSFPRIEIDKGTFVGCFSKKTDSLSQWRGYGRGEGGFCIVFRATQLWHAKQGSVLAPGYWLMPCDYDHERMVQLFKNFIEEALSECLEMNSSIPDDLIASKLATDVSWIGAGIKHPAFKEEEEWRLIYYGFNGAAPEIFFRENSTFTPYIKFPLGEKDQLLQLIEEVWVGPQRHADLAAAATRDFLRRELGGDVPVKVSKTPFRVL